MNKAELVDVIAEKAELSKVASGKALDALVEAVIQVVAEGGSVNLVGFGSFKAQARTAREGRNPKTGETISIPATTLPKFVPGVTFKNRVAEKADGK